MSQFAPRNLTLINSRDWPFVGMRLMVFSFVVCAAAMQSTPASSQLIEPIVVPANEAQRVNFWLESAWKKSLENRDRSVEMQEVAPIKDESVMLAYAINRLQHNRAREASATIASALRIAPENLDVLMLDVWLKTLRDDYDAALAAMRSFAKTLAKRALPADRLDAAYRRFGRLLGYLQGPVGDQVNQEILRAAVTELSAGLAPQHQQMLTDEMNAVISDFEKRMKGFSQKVEQSVAEKEVVNEASRNAIAQENSFLQTQAEKLQDRKSDVQAEGALRIDAALARAQGLQSQLAALNADIDAVQFQVRSLRTSLFFYLNDPTGSPFLFDALRFQLQDKLFALGNLSNQAEAIAFQLNQASVEVARIRNQYGGQLTQLEKDFRSANLLQKRNAKRLVKLAEPPRPDANKVSLLTNRMTALNSYDQLPLELYRSEMLQAVR